MKVEKNPAQDITTFSTLEQGDVFRRLQGNVYYMKISTLVVNAENIVNAINIETGSPCRMDQDTVAVKVKRIIHRRGGDMTVIKCDICRKEIPVVKKNILGKEIDVISAGTVKCEICDVHHIFDRLDLCEECARDLSVKLDTEFLRIKLSAEERNDDTHVPAVVRCKDCRYNNTYHCPSHVDNPNGEDYQLLEGYSYCSHGERKEGVL